MREKSVMRQLECVLTDEELKDCSKKLAEAVRKQKEVENNLASYKSQMKSKLDECTAVIDLMSGKINIGKEWRDVKCNVVYVWEEKVKQYFRTDTGELVDTDIITEHELQEEAELNAPGK